VRGAAATSRRQVLRAVLAAPLLLAGCTSDPPAPPPPDPLAALAASARADAELANAVAAAVPALAAQAGAVAAARTEHAEALQREVDRERPPRSSAAPSSTAPPTLPADPAAAMVSALTEAEQAAAALVGSVPRYRAGLLGSVAAGCASLREVLA
jgi:hypothetical protein